MQNIFGAGALWATPTVDAYGNAVTNPTPVLFGVCQEIAVDVSFDTKMLYGYGQFPVAIARGKGKVSGKVKFGQINGAAFNVLFGQTITASILGDYLDNTGTLIPGTPFSITPTVPGTGTWTADLGVRDTSGVTYTRVASAPATGQYTVTAGVYLFATADTGKTVLINFQYTATSTVAKKSVISNLNMGTAPTFRTDILMPFNGKMGVFSLNNCVANKMPLQTKLDDFTIAELDFDAFADPNTGVILTYALSE
jgi:hypothetical protein